MENVAKKYKILRIWEETGNHLKRISDITKEPYILIVYRLVKNELKRQERRLEKDGDK